MGADLSILSLPEEQRHGGFEVSLEAVKSGYFRDAYNGWGLFALMSHTLDEQFSWWITSDREDLFTRDEEEGLVMTPEGVKKWWGEMKPKIRAFITSKKYYRGEYQGLGEPFKKIEITDLGDIEAIKEHAQLFDRFHTLAVELGSAIQWSV